MSTAAAEPAPAAKGKKKLIIIIAVAALVLVGGGVAAMLLMKQKAAAAEADGEEGAPAKPAAMAKHDPRKAPTFVPLDAFTVNLADRDTERYAQVGITLEIEDAHLVEQIKAFMPAIRNNILLAIADRTAADLIGREGKAQLAEKVRQETSRALGFEVDDSAEAAEPEAKPAKKKEKGKKKAAPATLPVTAVHFSNFIIQ
jgi:flagellar FliL protein